MKNSLTSTDCMDTGCASGNAENSFVATLRLALRTFLSKLNHIGSAIAVGEAGDLDAAQALRERNV